MPVEVLRIFPWKLSQEEVWCYHDVPKAPHHWTMKYPRFLHVPHCSTAWCCILNGGAVGHYRIRTSSGWILDHENTYSSFQQSHTPSIIHTHWKTQWIFNETVHSSSMRLKAPTRKGHSLGRSIPIRFWQFYQTTSHDVHQGIAKDVEAHGGAILVLEAATLFKRFQSVV